MRRVKRGVCALALVLLLPACALAVTEGVVEEAPAVRIDFPQENDSLFGAWEQGLDDIEQAARNVLVERLGCPKEMQLYRIDAGDNLPVGDWHSSVANRGDGMSDYLYINFRFTDERMGGEMSAQVGFYTETGRLSSCCLGRWYSGGEALREARLDTEGGLNRLKTEKAQPIIDDFLRHALSLTDYEIIGNHQVRLADGTMMDVIIGNLTNRVIRLTIAEFSGEAIR